jgi:hypothetical protein
MAGAQIGNPAQPECGAEWDAYVIGASEFERYHQAFPDMAALYTAALKQSLQVHRQAGDSRLKDGENRAAYREFQLAARRQPSDAGIQQKIQVAWADYSRALAVDNQRSRKQLTAGQREAIDQQLAFAARFKQEGRLDRALEEIAKAEMIDAQSIPCCCSRPRFWLRHTTTARHWRRSKSTIVMRSTMSAGNPASCAPRCCSSATACSRK